MRQFTSNNIPNRIHNLRISKEDNDVQNDLMDMDSGDVVDGGTEKQYTMVQLQQSRDVKKTGFNSAGITNDHINILLENQNIDNTGNDHDQIGLEDLEGQAGGREDNVQDLERQGRINVVGDVK
ncbi:hypothetical protein HDU76_005577, partial [Blyttiomyces sp. JEL0837]